MPSLTKIAFSNTIRSMALDLGFHACGIAPAGYLKEDAEYLEDWLARERHGEMGYMANYFEKRTDPSRLFPGARSVIVVLQNYYPAETIGMDGSYRLSRYAYGEDYHHVMKRKLAELAAFITGTCEGSATRAFVDSAPVLERAWAREAGLGWIGKNTCLITPKQGSYFFIGTLLTDVELHYDTSRVPDHCGGCKRCIEACPTGALDGSGLDARKCISYLTIEYRGENLPEEFSGKMENWIFGCDICQEVCPWNRLSEPHAEEAFNPADDLKGMTRDDWDALEKESFRTLFRRSAVKRTKYEGLRRNITFLNR